MVCLSKVRIEVDKIQTTYIKIKLMNILKNRKIKNKIKMRDSNSVLYQILLIQE